MTLNEVTAIDKFEEFYSFNNLKTVEEKISYLKKEMKVRATIYDEDETKEEILKGLEESALLGCWKAF